MKNKNLIIVLIIVLVLVVALVAGGVFFFFIKDKDKNTNDEKEKTSQNETSKENENKEEDDKDTVKTFNSIEDLAKEFAKNYNKSDAKKVAELIDIDEFKDFAKNSDGIDSFEDVTKKDIEDAYDYIFEQLDSTYDATDIKEVEGPDDLEELLGQTVTEEEYEEVAQDYIVYAIKITNKELNEDAYDLMIIKENKKKYTLVTTSLLSSGISAVELDVTTDDDDDKDTRDDDNDDDFDINDTKGDLAKQEIELFNAAFELYKGSQAGAKIKILLESIVSNNIMYANEETKILSIEYLAGEDDTLEDIVFTPKENSDVDELVAGISASHKYKVSFTKNLDGRIDTIKIEY